MKKPGLMICAAATLLVIAACSSKGSRRSYATPAYTYSTPAVAAPAEPSPPPPMAASKVFASPDAAMKALAEVCGTYERAAIEELFGPGAMEVLSSGDEVEDKAGALRAKALIEAGVTFEERGPEEMVAEVGKEKWPFPIPLVKSGAGWSFDLEAGKDELLSRRIGRNELQTIETLYAYVEAQKEYFAQGRDGNPPAYAQKVRSSEGRHDGLFWPTGEGEEPSPMGELVADARTEGYDAKTGEPRPFHGYFYKILTGQGANAPGGSRSYLDDKGLMTGGFAGIAWPATYGNSGIMTFFVSKTGIVFEKDLGPDTVRIASAITSYDPDKSWRPSPYKPEADDEE